MAGRGPAPKPNAQRRNKENKVRATVKYDGAVRGPELPDAAGMLPPVNVRDAVSGEWVKDQPTEWHPRTVEVYEAFRSSPQAVALATDPDWQFLIDTMVVHDRFYRTGNFELAAELRQRMAKVGTTIEDRQRLRMEVEIPEQYPVGPGGAPGSVTSIDAARRKRLAGG